MILHWHFGPFLWNDTKTHREDLFIIQSHCVLVCDYRTLDCWDGQDDQWHGDIRTGGHQWHGWHVSIMSQWPPTWWGHVTLMSHSHDQAATSHNQARHVTQAAGARTNKCSLLTRSNWQIGYQAVCTEPAGRQGRFSKVANFKHCKPIGCRLTFLPSLQGGSLYISLL